MSLSNRFNREYQPLTPDYNDGFVEAYIRRSQSGERPDGRIADSDATFGGIIAWCLSIWFPSSHALDASIRVGTPDHSAYFKLILRHAVEFTLIFAICWGVDAYGRGLLWGLTGWCVINFLLLGTVMSFAQQDPSLFFFRVAQCWGVFAVLTLIPVVQTYSGFEMAVIAIFAVGLMWVVMFHGIAGFPDAVEKSVRLSVAAGLVITMSGFQLHPSKEALAPPVLWMIANYMLLLPLALNMQHWFAAHRYARLEDVRLYGRSAGVVAGRLDLLFAAARSHGSAFLSALMCSVMITLLLGDLLDHRSSAGEHFRSLLICLVRITGVAACHWIVTEVEHHKRLPAPGAFFSSYYTTWRCLAAWLSYSPPLNHPVAFSFNRPWKSRSMRSAIVALSLTVNSALAVTVLSDWTGQYLDEPSVVAGEANANPPIASKLERVASAAYLATILLGSILVPGLLLFFTLHSAWGPLFEAYSEHFERFRDHITPPLLTFRLRSR